ncbi:MAG: VOC family protein [Nocardioides sp.]
MADNDSTTSIVPFHGLHHVRLTVTDIERSKAFYTQLFGADPAMDFSDQSGDPEALEDPKRLYAGCVFQLGDQLLGLRPVANVGDRFDSTRVGLDHLSLGVATADDLRSAAGRLDEAGIENGGVLSLEGMGMSILSFQDPDDINLEMVAPEE